MQTALATQIAVLKPQGNLNAANASEFGRELTKVINSDKGAVVLVNMEEVESLDSAGLMVLVSALSLSQRQNKRFSLCSISASVRIVLELTQLDRVFEISENCSAFKAAIS